MADQDDPRFRGSPANRPAGGAGASAGESDPLAELARIVSGGSLADTGRRAASPTRDTGRPTGRDLARDLEAELLENLQASFDAIRAPLDPKYPHDTTAAPEPADEEPPYEPAMPAWDEPVAEEPVPRSLDAPAGDPRSRYRDEPDPRYAEEPAPPPADDDWTETAVDPRSWAEEHGDWSTAGDRFAAGPEPADDDAETLPDPLFPSAADFDRQAGGADAAFYPDPTGREDDADAGPVRPAASGALRDRWGFAPLPRSDEATDTTDEYADFGEDRSNDPYAPDASAEPAWADAAVEPAFDLSHDPADYRDERFSTDEPLEEQSDFEDLLDHDRDPQFTENYGSDDDGYQRRSEDAFDDDDDDDFERAPPVPPAAYAGRGERLAVNERPLAGSGGGRQSRRGLKVVATMLGVVLVGGVSAFALFRSSDDADILPPVIAASNDPFKVEPPKAESPDPDAGKISYDRIVSADQSSESRLSGSGSEPVLDVPPPPAPSEGSREISRIILPESSGGDATTPEPPAAASTTGQDDLAIQPRRVRTVVVRPDGTIVSNDTEPPSAPPVASAPPVPVPPSAPAQSAEASDPIRLTPPEPPALPDATAERTPPAPRISAEASSPAAEPPAPMPAAPSMVAETPAPEPTVAPAVVPPVPAARPATGNTTVAVRQPDPAPSVPISPFPSNPAPRPVQSAAASGGSTLSARPGDFVVQVSSQRSEEAALSTYQSLQRRFPALLGSFQPAIQRADLGEKGVYYRVRVGPMASREEAAAFCEQYRAAGGDCIVAQF